MANESSSSENDSLKRLFDKLDRNKDGKIDFQELKLSFNELKSFGSLSPSGEIGVRVGEDGKNDAEAKKLFELMTNFKKGGDVDFDFRDFVDYVGKTDKKIELIFKDLDVDKNGIIDKVEIKRAFENLGVVLDDQQIEKLMQHLDKNKSLQIDWKEWRDFFRFAPHDKMEEMLRHWRTESFVDYADQSIPNDYTIKEKQSGLWWRNLVAGGVAGAVSRSCTAPLDRIRIFLQVHGSEAKTGIVSACKNMVKEGGVSSLWRGNLINVLKITPESAIKFTAYEQIKALMGQEGATQLPPMLKFASGTLAGFISQTTIYPMEVLKTRLALRKTGQYNGVSDCVRKIYKTEGLRAFYRGYFMNTLGIGGVGVDFAIYETLKAKYRELYPETTHPSVVALLTMANTSSTVAMFSTYPLFLIRTKMQSSNNTKDTISNIARAVYKKDGFLGFYRGSLANLAKVAPSASIGYIVYENCSKYLGVKR